MRTFQCEVCNQTVYFENFVCGNCKTALGFNPSTLKMQALKEDATRALSTFVAPKGLKYCSNYQFNVCNWLVPAQSGESLCSSCSLNRTIPDLGVPGNTERWFEFEKAKRRLLYGLFRLGLPVNGINGEQPHTPLVFDILADAPTGHESGVITMNVSEADASVREQIRTTFNEAYRTLLGHFRHEIGHYYWLMLVNNDRWIGRFRELFGDETVDYAAALTAYHQNGPRADWQQTHISAYATSHPWEDWAESWAHYLHMVDALETANSYAVAPRISSGRLMDTFWPQPLRDPYSAPSAKKLIDSWIPLSLAINDLNRSMGHRDFYPFIISPPVIQKLEFIHTIIHSAKNR